MDERIQQDVLRFHLLHDLDGFLCEPLGHYLLVPVLHSREDDEYLFESLRPLDFQLFGVLDGLLLGLYLYVISVHCENSHDGYLSGA